jgi:hypothetical protein
MDKLRKVNNEFYSLYDSDGDIVASNNPKTPTTKKLSLKNCQAIENGYDLDEIKRKLFYGFDGQPSSFTTAAVEQTIRIMIEILGDKKFSEFDITKAFEYGWNQRHFDKTDEYELRGIQKRFIQSLQQTEWDVEIEMENSLCNGYKNHPDNVIGFIAEYKSVPKLDADGCLILKRK